MKKKRLQRRKDDESYNFVYIFLFSTDSGVFVEITFKKNLTTYIYVSTRVFSAALMNDGEKEKPAFGLFTFLEVHRFALLKTVDDKGKKTKKKLN